MTIVTIENAVKKAIEGHYKMTRRAIGKRELKDEAERIIQGMEISPTDFDRVLETLKREKRISETKPGYYAPYGVEVNDGPFPTAKDIVPTPKRQKGGSGRKA